MTKNGLRFGFVVIASVMLLLIGISTYESRSQETCQDCICPGLNNDAGWFDLSVLSFDDFTAGLLGTIESLGAGAPNIGGLDWLYNDGSFLNTTDVGSQLITWWSQKNGRNTYIQVTNTTGFCAFEGGIIQPSIACVGVQDCPEPGDPRTACLGVPLEVKFLGEDCVELTNFCDPYTPGDTHVYNLGDLIDNNGIPRNDRVLQGREGIFAATPVNNCEDETAISWNFLQGNMRMIDQNNDTDYGTNIYTRDAVFFNTLDECPLNALLGPTLAGCFLEAVEPTQLKHNFFEAGVAAAADLVVMSFSDDYDGDNVGGLGPYEIIPGVSQFTPDDFCDDEENCNSCPSFFACFARTGLNDEFPVSEDFAPPTPTPTITPVPTVTPTATPTGTATATPTQRPSSGGGIGCDIAGAPAQLGTAMANILIPLVPAFAIGYRIIRRRGRKEGK